MARELRRHIQQRLGLPAPNRGRKNKPGAGRPRKAHAGEPHLKRHRFDKLRVVHVTLRLVRGFGTLRRRDTYEALRRATRAILERAGEFRVVHLSPEGDHIHLIVEAEHHEALWRGMQAFQISAAQHLNRAVSKRSRRPGFRRRGKVFADRYFPRTVTSPTQARNTLNYVLNNWRRHGQDETSIDVRYWEIDYMSSAISFDGWRELERPDFAYRYRVAPAERLCVSPPHSWLLRVGWRKAGTISMYAVPGRKPPWKASAGAARDRRR